MKHLIFIPTQNNGHILPELFKNAQLELKDMYFLIINDASTDNTIDFLNSLDFENLTFFNNMTAKGYGGVQKMAYQYAIENDFETVTMLHGDGQYPYQKIRELIQALQRLPTTAMSFGSRIKGDPLAGGMPILRYLVNRGLTKMQNIVLRSNLSEFHSGFRSYKVQVLKELPFKDFSDNFLFDNQIIAALLKRQRGIEEITIPTHYGVESSSISIYQSFLYTAGIVNSFFKK